MADSKKEYQRILDQLWHSDKWPEARECLLKWLNEFPDDHWILAHIAETYYQEKNYPPAVEYAQRAWKLEPRCPLVLWEYSEILRMMKRYNEAESIYRGLIHRGAKRIAYGECGEGIRSARRLVNDCYYALSYIEAKRGEFVPAKRHMERHLANRSRNCPSFFALRNAKIGLDKYINKGIRP